MRITIRGDKELAAAFMRAPDLLKKSLTEGLDKSAKLVKQNARRKAGSPPIVNTGELARGIDYQLTGLTARVGSDAKYAPFVEYGRGAGRMPPVAAIERWARTKLGASGAGFAIARKIARTGTKPQPYFYPAVEQSLNDIKSIFERSLEGFIRSL